MLIFGIKRRDSLIEMIDARLIHDKPIKMVDPKPNRGKKSRRNKLP